MKIQSLVALALSTVLLSSCSWSEATCSGKETIKLFEASIRKDLNKKSYDLVKDLKISEKEEKIESYLKQITFSLEQIRTTKNDPDSTQNFCSGILKMDFGKESLKSFKYLISKNDAKALEELYKSADQDAGAEMGDTYMKVPVTYMVQQADNGATNFIEIEDRDSMKEVISMVSIAPIMEQEIKRKEK